VNWSSFWCYTIGQSNTKCRGQRWRGRSEARCQYSFVVYRVVWSACHHVCDLSKSSAQVYLALFSRRIPAEPEGGLYNYAVVFTVMSIYLLYPHEMDCTCGFIKRNRRSSFHLGNSDLSLTRILLQQILEGQGRSGIQELLLGAHVIHPFWMPIFTGMTAKEQRT